MKLQEAEGQESADAREARKATIEALRRVKVEGKGTGDKWINNNYLSSGEDGDDEEGEIVDEERLESLLARGDALDFDALTPGEQRAFLAAVASGELGKAVEVCMSMLSMGVCLWVCVRPLFLIKLTNKHIHILRYGHPGGSRPRLFRPRGSRWSSKKKQRLHLKATPATMLPWPLIPSSNN